MSVANGSIEFSYDAELGIRIATYSGKIDDDILLQAYNAIVEDPDFVPLAHDLADLRDIDGSEVSMKGLKALGDLLASPATCSRASEPPGLAIVATSKFIYGMARMYELMTQSFLPKRTKVFKDMDKAMEWLKSLAKSV